MTSEIPEGFKQGRGSDSDEKALGQKHLRPKNAKASVNLPGGKWIDLPKGMVAAPGTYVDDNGVLRDSKDNSCVVWHNIKRNEKGGKIHCQRRGIQPEEIVYDPDTGAPWCPECWPDRKVEKKDTASKIKKFLDSSAARN